jgi:hypothetical protein
MALVLVEVVGKDLWIILIGGFVQWIYFHHFDCW